MKSDNKAVDPLWCAWFSGLVDGEGYFQIRTTPQNYCDTHLTIVLREDDHAVLENIKATLQCGGLFFVSKQSDRLKGSKGKDQIMWRCIKLKETSGILVPLFDSYPLRTKKMRDYKCWREATLLLASHGYRASGVKERLIQLDKALRLQRHSLDRDETLNRLHEIEQLPLQAKLFY